eukprot:5033255-Prymnesium_polylepis.1
MSADAVGRMQCANVFGAPSLAKTIWSQHVRPPYTAGRARQAQLWPGRDERVWRTGRGRRHAACCAARGARGT